MGLGARFERFNLEGLSSYPSEVSSRTLSKLSEKNHLGDVSASYILIQCLQDPTRLS